MNKQADVSAYLKQLALERIGGIPIDAFQVYTDGSRDDYYRSSSGIYIKSQDHILKIQTVARFFADARALKCAQTVLLLHPRVPRAHQAGSSRRFHAGAGLSESVRCHGPGLALC
ncbi:hypothetical protein TNCV_3177061 [Trichonephila clavipes]|nr:hypothetical protein TNCV_3177061 [Trichonephila clavipes]